MNDLRRSYAAPRLTLRGREFAWGSRTYVMGIINATPDSFSGDGIGTDADAAVRLALRMEAEGADWLDIGGESSRPGADELDPVEELRRVLPVLEAVRAATGLPLSIDTYHASVARAALAAGADAVNDIMGLRRDPEMARVVAESGAVLIAMHNQRGRQSRDVAGDITEGFRATLDVCREHRIGRDRIILDPGFGFGWTPAQNLEMLRRLRELTSLGFPLLVGTSRKSTIGAVLGDKPVEKRAFGTAASVAIAIAHGADIIRVHDVAEMVDAARVADGIAGRGPFGGTAAMVAIALGSNLGDRLGNLRAAVRELEQRGVLRVADQSSVWETAPVPADQPAYLNAAVRGVSSLPPLELLAALKEIERALGRRPERRWGPRTIDLDIIFYGEERVEMPELRIPHERVLERGFVLAPLSDIFHGPLPVLGVTAAERLGELGDEGLRRLGAL